MNKEYNDNACGGPINKRIQHYLPYVIFVNSNVHLIKRSNMSALMIAISKKSNMTIYAVR